MNSDEQKKYWHSQWDKDKQSWDIESEHPCTKQLFERAEGRGLLKPSDRIYVPGCGHAHDGAWLARRSYAVTGHDYVEKAIQQAKSLYGREARLVLECKDFFNLNEPEASFSAIFDRACFCAIDPTSRARFLDICAGLLKPGGLFISIFFTRLKQISGPPYALSLEEIFSLMEKRFVLEFGDEVSVWEPAKSIIEREFPSVWRLKPASRPA